VEQLIWYQISEQLDVNSYYSGVISLESTDMLADKLLQSKSLRKEFPIIFADEIKELNKLKDLRLESSKAGFDGKTTVRKSQAEESKLNDRLQFILQLASKLQGKDLDLADLYALSVGDESVYKFIVNLTSLLIK
jgi:hypothetical protein